MTSKATQMPHAFVCDRFVVAPSPFQNRYAIVGIPARRIAVAIALTGVRRLLAYARRDIPRKNFSLIQGPPRISGFRACSDMAFLLLSGAFRGSDLVATFAERVHAHEKRRPESDDEGHGRERAVRELRIRLLLDAGGQRQGLERHVGDVEPARAARLVLAVNLVDVLLGVRVDACLGLFKEVRALAELKRAGGADLRACGRKTLRLASRTEGALLDEGRHARELVLRDSEGAHDHAVAAAEAAVGVVDDRPIGGLLERLDDAPRGAGRLDAVHALHLREAILAGGALLGAFLDDREGRWARHALRGEHGVIPGHLGAGERVRLGARGLAAPAADAARRVHKDAAGALRRGRDRGARRRRDPSRARGAGYGAELEESATIQLHRRLPQARAARATARSLRRRRRTKRSARGTVAIMGPPSWSRAPPRRTAPRAQRPSRAASPPPDKGGSPRTASPGRAGWTRAGRGAAFFSSGRRRNKASRLP